MRTTSGAAPATMTRPEAWRDLLPGDGDGASALPNGYDIELGIEPELANVVSPRRRKAAQLIRETDRVRA